MSVGSYTCASKPRTSGGEGGRRGRTMDVIIFKFIAIADFGGEINRRYTKCVAELYQFISLCIEPEMQKWSTFGVFVRRVRHRTINKTTIKLLPT